MRKQPKWQFKRGKIVKNFRNFLFENDELLKKFLLNKKFLKLIKEYAVIFLEFLEDFFNFSKSPNLRNVKTSQKILKKLQRIL